MGQMAIPVMLAGAAYTAYSQYQTGQYNKKVNDIMAGSALASGQFAESTVAARGTRTIAAGTAAYAGAGVDVGRGSPVDVAGGTRAVSALDLASARYNALREAYGYRLRGDQAEAEGNNAASGTLLTAGSQIAGYAYKSGMFNPPNSDPSSAAPYYLAAPGAAYDATTLPTFARGGF